MGLAITYGYLSMAFQEDNDFLAQVHREASAMASGRRESKPAKRNPCG
jgi:hypothetical protein